MTTITATSAIRGLLDGLTTTTEIRDSEGNLLGYYTPAAERERKMYKRAIKSIDFNEVNRRVTSNGPYYTTEQVLAHLRSLEST